MHSFIMFHFFAFRDCGPRVSQVAKGLGQVALLPFNAFNAFVSWHATRSAAPIAKLILVDHRFSHL
jgi:hypothetical protein